MRQLTLFPHVDELLNEQVKFVRAAHAKNTEINYEIDWRDFRGWCGEQGFCSLPASGGTLAAYITSLLNRGLKISTAYRRIHGIAHAHRAAGLESPTTPLVLQILKGAQRARREQPDQRAAMSLDQMKQICARLFSERTPISFRNRAILLLGFTTALRQCNIVAMRLDDLTEVEQGLLIRVRFEKHDQEAVGRDIGVPFGRYEITCPVRAVRDWVAVRGIEPGPLFTRLDCQGLRPLGRDAIAKLVKASVGEMSLGDPRRYGAHSLRAGFVTATGEAGVNHLLIAAQTGHRSLNSIQRYFRRANPFRGNACKALDL